MRVTKIIVGVGKQNLGKGTGRIGNRKKNSDYPIYSIVEIGQNIEKSPGDPRRLETTLTPIKHHKLTLV